jgi:hypothetical protein
MYNSQSDSSRERGAYGKGVGGEYGGNIMYSCRKMEKYETILRMGREGIKENDGRGKFKYDIL